ncbi:hypothetical protein DL767_006327 [Monosporascus sp. MG133]|nr:hypothetical protein DL767_006327 [Monosporascus sp. MG133]
MKRTIWRPYWCLSAVQELRSDRETSKPLVDLLGALRKPKVRDEHGNDAKDEWDDRYWANLPTFTSGVSGVRDKRRLGRSSPGWSGMAYYVKSRMREALAGPYPYDTPEPRYRAATYTPTASAWISIAGQKIYGLCRGGESGFDLPTWESWEKGSGEVAASDEVDGEAGEIALRARDDMRAIQRRLDT